MSFVYWTWAAVGAGTAARRQYMVITIPGLHMPHWDPLNDASASYRETRGA